MSVQSNQELGSALSDEDVAAHLAANPDFFERHPDLLASLRISHPVRGGVVSLIERQVAVLRHQNHRLQRKLQVLMQNAYENEGLMRRIHQLSLTLLHAQSLNEVLESAREQLSHGFKTEFVELRLFRPMREEVVAAPLEFERVTALFPRLIETRRPLCGTIPPDAAQLLFGDEAVEVRSTALLLLSGAEPLGLLALGSRDPARFMPSIGTLFLAYLGELIATSIGVHLDPSHG